MKSATTLAVLLAALAATNVRAGECTTEQVAAADALVSTNKALFQSCLTDLKTASSGAAATSFLSAAYVSASAAAPLCASDNCVKALIAAMEKFPDCCSPAGASGVSAVTNLPRLADDILHQCDVIDEKLLGMELEKEIAKLPDLKVQIKSVKSATATGSGSASGLSGNASVSAGDVDVVIDVKKRELMKDGTSIGKSTGVEPTSATSSAVPVRSSSVAVGVALIAALAVFA